MCTYDDRAYICFNLVPWNVFWLKLLEVVNHVLKRIGATLAKGTGEKWIRRSCNGSARAFWCVWVNKLRVSKLSLLVQTSQQIQPWNVQIKLRTTFSVHVSTSDLTRFNCDNVCLISFGQTSLKNLLELSSSAFCQVQASKRILMKEMHSGCLLSTDFEDKRANMEKMFALITTEKVSMPEWSDLSNFHRSSKQKT